MAFERHWQPDPVFAAFAGPPGYRLEQASADDVPAIIDGLRAWFPEIQAGAESVHFEPEFYAREVFLRGGDPARANLVLTARAEGSDALAAVLTLSCDARSRSLSGRLGAVAPEHRSHMLGFLGVRLLEAFGRHMHADLLTYTATMKTRHQQVIAERFGFTPVGIMPATDLTLTDAGAIVRTYEVLYAKVLSANVQRPSTDAMTAKTRALYMHIFGGSEA